MTPAESSSADEFSLVLKFKDSVAPVATLVVTKTVTVTQLNYKLLNAVPELRREPFCFLVRGKPVWPEHWDGLTAPFFRNDICLGRGSVDGYLADHLPPVVGGGAGGLTRAATAATQPTKAAAGLSQQGLDDRAARAAAQQAALQQQLLRQQEQGWNDTADASDSEDDEDEEVPTLLATALYDFAATDATHVSFKAGTTLLVVRNDNAQWWFGEVGDQRGWFPASYAQLINADGSAVGANAAGRTAAATAAAAATSNRGGHGVTANAPATTNASLFTNVAGDNTALKPAVGYTAPKAAFDDQEVYGLTGRPCRFLFASTSELV